MKWLRKLFSPDHLITYLDDRTQVFEGGLTNLDELHRDVAAWWSAHNLRDAPSKEDLVARLRAMRVIGIEKIGGRWRCINLVLCFL